MELSESQAEAIEKKQEIKALLPWKSLLLGFCSLGLLFSTPSFSGCSLARMSIWKFLINYNQIFKDVRKKHWHATIWVDSHPLPDASVSSYFYFCLMLFECHASLARQAFVFPGEGLLSTRCVSWGRRPALCCVGPGVVTSSRGPR